MDLIVTIKKIKDWIHSNRGPKSHSSYIRGIISEVLTSSPKDCILLLLCCIFLTIWMLRLYFYIIKCAWILRHFLGIQWMYLSNKPYSLIVEKWSEVPWWKHNVWCRYAFLWSWRMGPWFVLFSFVVAEFMQLYKNFVFTKSYG